MSPFRSSVRRSLRGKMVLGSVVVAVSAMLVLSVATLVAGRYTFRHHLVGQVTSVAHLLAENAGAALLFRDAADAAALLHTLRTNPSILSCAVYGRDGRQLAAYHRDPAVARAPELAPAADLLRISWSEIEVGLPVLVEGAAVGSIAVRAGLNEIHSFTVKLSIALVGSLLLAGVLASLLSSRLNGIIARPVGDLARTAAEVSASKNYELRAQKRSADELGALTDSFNEMLETIQARDQALRENEEKYRTLIENAGDAILVAQDGGLPFANPQAIRLTGYTAEELRRISWVEIIHPDDRALLQERHRARIAGEAVSETVAFRLQRKGGELRWVQLNSVSLAWEGRPATLNFARDVTEQVKIEEHLRQNQKMEAIGTLAGGIAHDFNNILSIMLGFVEIALLRIPKKSTAEENLRQVLAAGERATNLVAQILTFSREVEAAPLPCEILPIVKETVKFMRASLPANIVIRERLEPVGMVVADPTRIHQVILNLCTNASHAMETGDGVLEVTLSEVAIDETGSRLQGLPQGRFALLTVSDTGTGIPPEIQARIFEPYFTTKPAGKGTGLGLAVVHGIVTKAGGKVKVYSEPGAGTIFSVYLPVLECPESGLERRESEAQVPRGSERILLVDDEQQIVAILRESLEALGYAVTATTNGEEALRIFREDAGRFDLVISDLTMPRLNGAALTAEIRAVRPEIPVILCTGFSEGLTQERLSALGVGAVLTKPISRIRLGREIRRILDGSAAS